jgi:hypothetical protein
MRILKGAWLQLLATLGGIFVAGAVFCQTTPASGLATSSCEVVPDEIRQLIKDNFAGWMIQKPENMSATSRKRWESEKPLQCPGIAGGLFNDAKMSEYAVLLVPIDHPGAGYKLLIFAHDNQQHSYSGNVIDRSSDGGENVFIRTAPVRKFFDTKSREKFHAFAKEAVLFVNAGESEYETDIYFFANGAYHHEPVDY